MVDLKRIQQLDLNLLKVFQSLYVEQNMTKAAESLHITPSAVSHAIRRLRDVLNDPLFVRAQQKMVPTPACQRMAPLIIDTLTRLQQILQQWGDFDPQQSEQTFRIGMHDALEASVLPILSSVLAKRAPNTSIASVKVERNNLTRELASGHLDLALDVAIPAKPPVHHRTLWSSPFCVMMRVDHPLAGKLNKRNYLAATHISVSNRPLGMTMEDTYFQQRGLVRHMTIRCQNYVAAATILKTSDQLLTVSLAMSEQLLNDQLCVVDSPYAIPELSTNLYWHANTEQDAALSWLRTLIIDEIKPLNDSDAISK
ncbi:LysR family transcriptional regulator [Arenicella xantha]|uniref:LysR family transcriptional regulator n=1 Tax=Arenicella xantha TaxID=644221 RepID=A0A395JGP4_9GAMM|nr:LysR family transcriptional regulator [Arenicella xantha]RBP49117.1 LysR family transcriptional regulator [Arenicella xantha]